MNQESVAKITIDEFAIQRVVTVGKLLMAVLSDEEQDSLREAMSIPVQWVRDENKIGNTSVS